MVLTYSTSGEPGRLRSARGLKYVVASTWGTVVSQVRIGFIIITESPRGSSCTS